MNTGTKLSAPVSINLELTEQCNLGCFFCFCSRDSFKQKYNPLSSSERYKNLVKILDIVHEVGVLEVRFFGGEFTVVKKWRQLMEYAHRLNLFISFVSNGTLFSNEDVAFIKNIGITECSVSLHGKQAIHDKITDRLGSFKKTVSFIQKLQGQGISVAVPFTPNRFNLPHFEDFVVSMSENYGIEGIGMNRLYKDDGSYGELKLSDYLEIFRLLDKINNKHRIPINFIDSFPRCLIPVKYWKYMMYCSQGIAFAQINALGDIKNCSSVNKSLGNIFQKDLRLIWENELQDFRALKHLPLSCKLCPIYCGGGCIATRTMKENFIADEFIKIPKEEKILDSISITAKNYLKKYQFQIPSYLKNIKKTKKKKPIDKYPLMKYKYKIRKENDNEYVGLFDHKGMLFLDQVAVDVLKMLNGKNSIQKIVKSTKLSSVEITDIIEMFMN